MPLFWGKKKDCWFHCCVLRGLKMLCYLPCMLVHQRIAASSKTSSRHNVCPLVGGPARLRQFISAVFMLVKQRYMLSNKRAASARSEKFNWSFSMVSARWRFERSKRVGLGSRMSSVHWYFLWFMLDRSDLKSNEDYQNCTVLQHEKLPLTSLAAGFVSSWVNVCAHLRKSAHTVCICMVGFEKAHVVSEGSSRSTSSFRNPKLQI